MTFELTPKQQEAMACVVGDAVHSCLFGGSRSGKTFLLVRQVILRATKAHGSRHVIFRYRFNAIKASIVFDTFPKVLSLAFPGLAVTINKTDYFALLPNGSEIWFAGLDEKERAEKVLGMEFSTIYLNECSQIPESSKNLVLTRLAQLCYQDIPGANGEELKPRVFYDANPPSKVHWLYKTFIEKVSTETRLPLSNPENYESFRINPKDNLTNLSSEYLKTLEELPERAKKRFLYGQFADATPNALFTEETIDTWRVDGNQLPELMRVIVAVDPSGAGDEDNADNDAIGIVVGALGVDGNAYILEDCTVKAGPATWGRVATSAYDRHQADLIVGEVNYGGAMVEMVIKAARPKTPFKKITSSRGKKVRAEPFSALYEQGKIRHVGRFIDLEDELCSFSTLGYMGARSPNRADALIFVLAELFPGVVRSREDTYKPPEERVFNLTATSSGWMR